MYSREYHDVVYLTLSPAAGSHVSASPRRQHFGKRAGVLSNKESQRNLRVATDRGSGRERQI